MCKGGLLILFVCVCGIRSFAQRNMAMDALDSTARVFTQQGKWDSALPVMHQLNALKPYNAFYIHNTACIHASKENADSAFKYLYLLADTLPHLLNLSDPDFYLLMTSPRWSALEDRFFNSKRITAIVKDSAYARI